MQERTQLVVAPNTDVRDALAGMVRDDVMVTTPFEALTGHRFDVIVIAFSLPTGREERAYARWALRDALLPLLAVGGRLLPDGVLE